MRVTFWVSRAKTLKRVEGLPAVVAHPHKMWVLMRGAIFSAAGQFQITPQLLRSSVDHALFAADVGRWHGRRVKSGCQALRVPAGKVIVGVKRIIETILGLLVSVHRFANSSHIHKLYAGAG